MSRRVVPVSTLVNYLKKVMDENPVLHGVMIEGENQEYITKKAREVADLIEEKLK